MSEASGVRIKIEKSHMTNQDKNKLKNIDSRDEWLILIMETARTQSRRGHSPHLSEVSSAECIYGAIINQHTLGSLLEELLSSYLSRIMNLYSSQ